MEQQLLRNVERKNLTMRELRVLTGIVLILFGLGALAFYSFAHQDKLSDYEKKMDLQRTRVT
ncbi:hypothetical protein SD71_06235 [Cohnella kolymensis]|uniref:Uncharacterized protein n=1 Tax=Cohnella kolymensis TaxID=1590652 RepID=A0ABR5A6A6_9BACL|nr:hypothetical protein SD71_06235 [Cohnella kolymensis]